MDVDLSRWVLEFLLRQSIDDRVLNAVLQALPLSNDDSSLNKAMLLRRIESEIATGSVSEKVLEFLERIEELDHEEGFTTSEAMKSAYCAVAVDCSVRFLEESEEYKEGKYFDAVRRIWKGRVWNMERLDKVGLVSDELLGWKDEIEAAVWDASVCENVRMKKRGNAALEAVRLYVVEAWESMGPSFLELVAGTVSDDDSMREVFGLGNDRICDQVGERGASLLGSCPDSIVRNDNKEMQRDVVQRRRKQVANKRGAIAGTSRVVKITDTEELDTRTSSKNYDCLPAREINKVQEALRISSLELQAVAKDPLPDALHLAENLISSMGRENMNQETSARQNGLDLEAANPFLGKSAEAALANEGNLDSQCCRNQNNVPKPSLMAWNSTAHTYEWDDSVDDLPEESGDSRSRLHLSTPKRMVVSPLKKHEIKKLARRRKIKRWSTLEEDTLRTGVQKFGRGNWKLILNSYCDIFEERTEVDLKDKWRNMIRVT
ncbi:unnamed protein product [Camellia sinensis]